MSRRDIEPSSKDPSLNCLVNITPQQEQDNQACIASAVAGYFKTPSYKFLQSTERPISNLGLSVFPYGIMSRLELNQSSSKDNDSPSLDCLVNKTLKQVQDASTSTYPVVRSNDSISPSLACQVNKTLKQVQDASTSTYPVIRSKGITFSPSLYSQVKETLKQEQDGQACTDSEVAGYLKKSPLDNFLLSKERPISNLGLSVLPWVDKKTSHNIMSRLELYQPSSKDNDSPSLDCLVNKTPQQEQDNQACTDSAVAGYLKESPSDNVVLSKERPISNLGLSFLPWVAKKIGHVMSSLGRNQPSTKDNDTPSLDCLDIEAPEQEQDASTSTDPVIRSKGIIFSQSLYSGVKETLKQEQDGQACIDSVVHKDNDSTSLDCGAVGSVVVNTAKKKKG